MMSAHSIATRDCMGGHEQKIQRASDLLRKQNEYQKRFDAFMDSCSQPHSTASRFQKLWKHAMSLVSDWQELFDQQQHQLHLVKAEHQELRHEHQALQMKVQGLTNTLQHMFGDFSTLLQLINDPTNPMLAATLSPSQLHPLSEISLLQGPLQERDSSHGAVAATINGVQTSYSDAHQQQVQGAAAEGDSPAGPQTCVMPPTCDAPRRSSEIVHSLIRSIDLMNKQFADCQVDSLLPTPTQSTCSNRSSRPAGSDHKLQSREGHKFSSAASRVPPASKEQGHAFSKEHKQQRSIGASTTQLGPAAYTVDSAAQAVDGSDMSLQQHAVTQAAEDTAFSPSNRPAVNSGTSNVVPQGLIGARPSHSHPPSCKKVVPSPATAQRHTLAWFLQHAGSPCRVSSSMPNPSTPSCAEAAASAAGVDSLDATELAIKHAAAEANTGLVTRGRGTLKCHHKTSALTVGSAAGIRPQPNSTVQASAGITASRPTGIQAVAATPAPEHVLGQHLSLEPSISHWAGDKRHSVNDQSTSDSRAGIRGAVIGSTPRSRSSSRASLGRGTAVAHSAASGSAATAGGRSCSRESGRGLLRSSSTSLTAFVRNRQQQQEAADIYEYHSQQDQLTSDTAAMVAAAAKRLGLQGQQQQQAVKPGSSTSKRSAVHTTILGSRQTRPVASGRDAARTGVAAAAAAAGPLTAGLNRQGSLGRSNSAGRSSSSSSKQLRSGVVAAGTQAAAAAPGRTVINNQTGQRAAATGKQQQPGMRSTGERSSSAAAAVAGPLRSGNDSRPSSRTGLRTERRLEKGPHKAAPAAALCKYPKQPLLLQTQSAEDNDAQKAGTSSTSCSTLATSAVTAAAAANLGVSPFAQKQQLKTARSSDSNSSDVTEQSDMVLLGSCASTTACSAQTSPAFDSTATTRTSTAAAAETLMAAAGVLSLLHGHDSSVGNAEPGAAQPADQVGIDPMPGTAVSNVAAGTLKSTQEAATRQNVETAGTAVHQPTAPAAVSACKHSVEAAVHGSAGSKPNASSIDRVEDTPAAAAATHEDYFVTVEAAGDVQSELPDAIKMSHRADSPRKQPRKSTFAAAAHKSQQSKHMLQATSSSSKVAKDKEGHTGQECLDKSFAKLGPAPSSLSSPCQHSKRFRTSSEHETTDARDRPWQQHVKHQQHAKQLQADSLKHVTVAGEEAASGTAADGQQDAQMGAASVSATTRGDLVRAGGSSSGRGAMIQKQQEASGTSACSGAGQSACSSIWQGLMPDAVSPAVSLIDLTSSTTDLTDRHAEKARSRSTRHTTWSSHSSGIQASMDAQGAECGAAAAVAGMSSALPYLGKPAAARLTSYPVALSVEICSVAASTELSTDVVAAEHNITGHQEAIDKLSSAQSSIAVTDAAYTAAADSAAEERADAAAAAADNDEDAYSVSLAASVESIILPASVCASSMMQAADDGSTQSFSLQELLPIVLDIMDDKKSCDAECNAHKVPQLSPAGHLRRYVHVKVHGQESTYNQALAALLAALDQHKEHQPEVAVYHKVLTGEVDEDYFQQHLTLRTQLQLLAAHALKQKQRSQQSEPSVVNFCDELMSDEELSWMLGVWGRQRQNVLRRPHSSPAAPHDEQQLHTDWWTAVQSYCEKGDGKRLAAGVVDALLLWELQQQVGCLTSVVEAFKVADADKQGLLDLQRFRTFCYELNDAMSDDEVHALFTEELDKVGVDIITFNAICRCLLPAM